MKHVALLFLLLVSLLRGTAATNVPPHGSLLLDEKTVVELTAGFSQYEPLPRLEGKLVSSGSSLVTHLVNRWASEFATMYPDVVLEIEGGGSVASLPDFLNGKVDLMPMARPLWPSELKSFRDKFHYDPAEIIVAQDAVGIYVNKNNPVKGLTLAQLDGLYSRAPQRGGKQAEFWGELGVTGPLAEARITRLALAPVQGTHSFFQDNVMLGSDFRLGGKFELLSSSLVQAVGADEAAVGFASVMWETARTRLVPLETTNGDYRLPSYENTVTGQYPLARMMQIVFNRKPNGSMNPVAREFLRFAVSRRGQRVTGLAESFPLTVKQQQEALRIIGEAPAGEVESLQQEKKPGKAHKNTTSKEGTPE